jgi:hypothetical protein
MKYVPSYWPFDNDVVIGIVKRGRWGVGKEGKCDHVFTVLMPSKRWEQGASDVFGLLISHLVVRYKLNFPLSINYYAPLLKIAPPMLTLQQLPTHFSIHPNQLPSQHHQYTEAAH